MHIRSEIPGIIETRLNIPVLMVSLISSGLAVTFALMLATSRLTIIYIKTIKEVEIALPSLVTKLCIALPIPVSLFPVFHSI